MPATYRTTIPASTVRRLTADIAHMPGFTLKLAAFAHAQVEMRFHTQGQSGGVAWPQKRAREWGYDDGRSILTGATGWLLDSFGTYATDTQGIVNSFCDYAHVHHIGTVGKGGLLPTIRPKNGAKALFIPITDKAIKSGRYAGQRAAQHRMMHGHGESTGPIRVHERIKRDKLTKAGFIVDEPLVKGRLNKQHRLEKWDKEKGEYVVGVPDFLWLGKVDIAPRPMLPLAPIETQALAEFAMGQLVNWRRH